MRVVDKVRVVDSRGGIPEILVGQEFEVEMTNWNGFSNLFRVKGSMGWILHNEQVEPISSFDWSGLICFK